MVVVVHLHDTVSTQTLVIIIILLHFRREGTKYILSIVKKENRH